MAAFLIGTQSMKNFFSFCSKCDPSQGQGIYNTIELKVSYLLYARQTIVPSASLRIAERGTSS